MRQMCNENNYIGNLSCGVENCIGMRVCGDNARIIKLDRGIENIKWV